MTDTRATYLDPDAARVYFAGGRPALEAAVNAALDENTAGYTLHETQGGWRDDFGAVIAESAYVLELLGEYAHAGAAAAAQAILRATDETSVIVRGESFRHLDPNQRHYGTPRVYAYEARRNIR
jgi:hypothetical protein